MQDGSNVLSRPISENCNLSISCEVLPDSCKVAKLKPIYKKGKKTDPSNYRPILLLSMITKVIERIVRDQLNTFLSESDILYKSQSGFRANHSKNPCLSYLMDKVLKGFDENVLTGMILADLQKTFETINREVLLQKRKAIKFSEKSIQWFRSYLCDGIFLVKPKN